MNKYTKYMTQGAVIAAICSNYIDFWLMGYTYSVRISEALTVLPYLHCQRFQGFL